MAKIEIERLGSNFHFRATNESGQQVEMDGSPAIGGENRGVRPMEMLLCGLGGCSGIDVISILKKQKQEPESFTINIDGEREAGKEPSLWQEIRVAFSFTGSLDEKKVMRAVSLSMEKYCSVAKTLEKSATIIYTVRINGTQITP